MANGDEPKQIIGVFFLVRKKEGGAEFGTGGLFGLYRTCMSECNAFLQFI